MRSAAEQLDFGYRSVGALQSTPYAETRGEHQPYCGLPLTVRDGSTTLWTATGYNGRGQLTGETLGNGTHTDTEYAYEADMPWLASERTTGPAGSTLLDLSYGYDSNGNVTSRTDAVFGGRGFESYTYDGLSRMRTHQLGTNAVEHYDYDDLGNLTNNNGTAQTYSTTAPHQLATVRGAQVATDERGRVTHGPDFDVPAYTDFDLPASMNDATVQASFVAEHGVRARVMPTLPRAPRRRPTSTSTPETTCMRARGERCARITPSPAARSIEPTAKRRNARPLTPRAKAETLDRGGRCRARSRFVRETGPSESRRPARPRVSKRVWGLFTTLALARTLFQQDRLSHECDTARRCCGAAIDATGTARHRFCLAPTGRRISDGYRVDDSCVRARPGRRRAIGSVDVDGSRSRGGLRAGDRDPPANHSLRRPDSMSARWRSVDGIRSGGVAEVLTARLTCAGRAIERTATKLALECS